MESPTLNNWYSPFPFKGLIGGIFHFYSNKQTVQRPFIIHISKQCIETLIRRPINAASDLGLHGLPMSHKKDVMLMG